MCRLDCISLYNQLVCRSISAYITQHILTTWGERIHCYTDRGRQWWHPAAANFWITYQACAMHMWCRWMTVMAAAASGFILYATTKQQPASWKWIRPLRQYSRAYLCRCHIFLAIELVRIDCKEVSVHCGKFSAVYVDVILFASWACRVPVFRSTLRIWPNKVGLRCTSVRPYVHPQKVFLIPMKFGM